MTLMWPSCASPACGSDPVTARKPRLHWSSLAHQLLGQEEPLGLTQPTAHLSSPQFCPQCSGIVHSVLGSVISPVAFGTMPVSAPFQEGRAVCRRSSCRGPQVGPSLC